MKKFVFAKSGTYVNNEETLKELINENEISKYYKLPLIKVGDYVICCDRKESIDPKNNADCWNKSSWREGKVIKTQKVVVENNIYYVTGRGAMGGVYCSGVRFMTQEEIKDYENHLLP